MSQKEREFLVSAISTIVVLILYSLIVYNRKIVPNIEIINDFSFWGKIFLLFIPIMIVSQIIIHIITTIIESIITQKEPECSSIIDERDKLIRLKTITIAHWVFCVGFMVAMALIALGNQPWTMFVTLIATGFVSSIVSDIAGILYYRRGV